MEANTAVLIDPERRTLNLWPDTGRILGLSRGATFQAAKKGQIPVIKIGKRLLVSKALLERLLDGGGSLTPGARA